MVNVGEPNVWPMSGGLGGKGGAFLGAPIFVTLSPFLHLKFNFYLANNSFATMK